MWVALAHGWALDKQQYTTAVLQMQLAAASLKLFLVSYFVTVIKEERRKENTVWRVRFVLMRKLTR